MFNLRPRLVSVLLLLLAIAPALGQERVAVLYAHNQQALYRIDPNDGEFFKIGDLPQQVDYAWSHLAVGIEFEPVFREMIGAPLVYTSMVWADVTRSLYVSGYSFTQGGELFGPTELEFIAAVDPSTAKFTPLWFGLGGVVAFGRLTYDPHNRQLYMWFGDNWILLQPIDPLSGHFGTAVRVPGFAPARSILFDNRGHRWDLYEDDQYARLQEFASDGTALGGTDMFFPFTGGIPTLNNVPAYFSLSFDPFTGQLFALGLPLHRDSNASDPEIYVDSTHFILCIVDPTTAKPHKIIATYDRPNEPNWPPLQIAWGVSH